MCTQDSKQLPTSWDLESKVHKPGQQRSPQTCPGAPPVLSVLTALPIMTLLLSCLSCPSHLSCTSSCPVHTAPPLVLSILSILELLLLGSYTSTCPANTRPAPSSCILLPPFPLYCLPPCLLKSILGKIVSIGGRPSTELIIFQYPRALFIL